MEYFFPVFPEHQPLLKPSKKGRSHSPNSRYEEANHGKIEKRVSNFHWSGVNSCSCLVSAAPGNTKKITNHSKIQYFSSPLQYHPIPCALFLLPLKCNKKCNSNQKITIMYKYVQS